MTGSQLSPELVKLLDAARQAREHAYATYSGFKVGSAVLTDDGRIVTGANVENASYGLTMCAERTAVSRAVVEKHCRIVAVAVCAEPAATPCGMCRQTLVQFAGDDCPVIIGTPNPAVAPQVKRLGDLLPDAFRLRGAFEQDAQVPSKPTTVIEFWGSPGAGKSTFAAECFAAAAKDGLDCHLVTEFIKDHAIRKLPLGELDQPWILGEQTRKESATYGRYDFVFTDSPILLPCFFGRHYDEDDLGLSGYAVRWENRAKHKYGINRIRLFLPLKEEFFKLTGRYESFSESKQMNDKLFEWIKEVTGQSPDIIENRDREHFLEKYLRPLDTRKKG